MILRLYRSEKSCTRTCEAHRKKTELARALLDPGSRLD
jgi:hypothetical protein